MMVRYLMIALLTVLVIASTGIAQERTKGLYFANGLTWSGLGTTGEFGYFTGAGVWLKVGNGLYLVAPGQSDIQNSKHSSLAINPFIVLEVGDFLISTGPGVAGYIKSDLELSYAQFEGSITWLFSNPKWYNTTLSGTPENQTGAPMKAGVTLLARYLPGNKHKTLILSLTVLN